jgi:hypothetical protein
LLQIFLLLKMFLQRQFTDLKHGRSSSDVTGIHIVDDLACYSRRKQANRERIHLAPSTQCIPPQKLNPASASSSAAVLMIYSSDHFHVP